MRLERVGRKHEPSFRLVLTDSKNSTKSGRFEEVLGAYDPRKSTDSFKTDRIKHWISQGIGFSPTVHNLFVKHRILNAKKIDVAAPTKGAAASATSELTTEQAPVAEEAPVSEPEVAAAEPTVIEAAPEPETISEPVAVVEEVPVVEDATIEPEAK